MLHGISCNERLGNFFVLSTKYNLSDQFGLDLVIILSEKLLQVYPEFNSNQYKDQVLSKCSGLSYSQRVQLHAELLYQYLPQDFDISAKYILKTLGEENPNETGTFKYYYWILPYSKYIENYGVDYLKSSLSLIQEITKRSTGEYAIRPFIRKYPKEVVAQMKLWAKSDNFHLRRLASEGLRPKLPWAPKLDLFVEQPEPVFEILDLLKEDSIKYVQKSVANHLTDYLKLSPRATISMLSEWKKSRNMNTQWIIKHANRKLKLTI